VVPQEALEMRMETQTETLSFSLLKKPDVGEKLAGTAGNQGTASSTKVSLPKHTPNTKLLFSI
jgi:hypothetical protein